MKRIKAFNVPRFHNIRGRRYQAITFETVQRKSPPIAATTRLTAMSSVQKHHYFSCVSAAPHY